MKKLLKRLRKAETDSSTSRKSVPVSEISLDVLQTDAPTVTYDEAAACCELCRSFDEHESFSLETLLEYEGKGCSLSSLLLRILRLYDA